MAVSFDTALTAAKRPRMYDVAARAITWLSMAIATAVCVVCLSRPVALFPRAFQAAYNEGWNAYRASYVLSRVPLYGKPPVQQVTNYPPVSFWLIAALSRAPANVNRTGRWVSVSALLLVAIESACLAYLLESGVAAAVFAPLFFLLSLGVFAPTYVATNDPQMLAHAVMMAGVLLYVWRGRTSAPMLVVVCALMCAGEFIKHNLLAFPVAITIDLLLHSRKRLYLWCLTWAVMAGTLVFLIVRLEGPYFVDHLLAARSYSLERSWTQTWRFLSLFWIPLLTSIAWMALTAAGTRRDILVWAFPAAFGAGVTLSGGGGVYVNIFFEVIILIAIICALLIRRLADMAMGLSPTLQRVIAVMPCLLLISLIGRVIERRGPPNIGRDQAEYLAAVRYLRSKPDPVICENLLLCFDSGKRLEIDPFWMGESVKVGRVPEAYIVQLLRQRSFTAIQLDLAADRSLPKRGRSRLASGFINEALQSYRTAYKDSRRVFLVAEPEVPRTGNAVPGVTKAVGPLQ